MSINFKSVLLMVLILLVCKIDAQTNSGTSQKSWEWKGHNNWFLPTGDEGNILNQTTGVTTRIQDPDTSFYSKISGYQGVTCASNDQGKLLFFSNGIRAWRADGSLITKELWAGTECGFQTGTSAVHGVMTVRHPLTPHKYYIITIDDIVNQGVTKGTGGHHENNCSPPAGNPGLESHGIAYAVIDSNANLVHSSQAIESNIITNLQGQLRTTEDMAATMHANGVDIWITFHPLWATHVVSYLLTVDGFVTAPVVSGEGLVPYVDIHEGIGGLDFTQDGSKLALGVDINTSGLQIDSKEAYGTINLYDFDNKTGEISNRLAVYKNEVSSGQVYNIIWGPYGKWLHYSGSGVSSEKVDISSNDETTIRGTYQASTELSSGIGFNGAAITASGVLKTSDVIYQTAGLTSRFSTNNMYIPPSEKPVIQQVVPLCDADSSIDLSTVWMVNKKNAEDSTAFPNAYQGKGITNTGTGVFNPKIAGYGTHKIIFTRSGFADTISILVSACKNCTDTVTQDTTVYFVDDVKFSSISPKLITDSTIARVSVEGCDSVVNYFSNFVFSSTYCSVTTVTRINDTTTTVLYHIDTTQITVTDTNYINVNNYVNVYDSLIVDLTGVITSLDAPFNKTLQVKVYPNPASEVLILEVLDAEVTASYTYELMNINGQIVEANGSLSSNTNTIDISSYAGGTYYVKFYDAQQKMVNQAPVLIRK